MHLRDHLELALVVATHYPHLLRQPEGVTPDCLHRYWVASKCRLDRYARAMRPCQKGASVWRPRDHSNWYYAGMLVEEVLASEVLAKTWGRVLEMVDQVRGEQEAGPIARSVIVGHMELRCRALGVLQLGLDRQPGRFQKNDRQRRWLERWSDLILVRLSMGQQPQGNYADQGALCRLQAAWSQSPSRGRVEWAWSAISAMLHLEAQSFLPIAFAGWDLNRELAQSVLQAFPRSAHDDLGVPLAAWRSRFEPDACRFGGPSGWFPHTATATNESNKRRF